MAGGGTSEYDASTGPTAGSMGASPSSAALKGLLGTLANTGSGKNNSTGDILRAGLQMMQRPQQQIQPQQFAQNSPMGGLPQVPGMGQIPMGQPQQPQQSLFPMTQFPRF